MLKFDSFFSCCSLLSSSSSLEPIHGMGGAVAAVVGWLQWGSGAAGWSNPTSPHRWVCNVSHEKVSDMEDSLQITTTANEIKYKLGRWVVGRKAEKELSLWFSSQIRLLNTNIVRGQDFWKENVVEYAGGTKEKAGAGGCRVGWKTAQISGMPMCESGWWFLNPDLRWEKMSDRLMLPHSLVSKAVLWSKNRHFVWRWQFLLFLLWKYCTRML